MRETPITSKLLRFQITDGDRTGIPPRVHLVMLELVTLIRGFELILLELSDEGLVHGPLHSSIGQEAVAAGCGAALMKEDLIGSTHRAHHHFLGKALPCSTPEDYDPAASDFTGEMRRCVYRTLAEILGLKDGWCGGRGGSMHLKSAEAGVLGTNAIVGGGIALTTGAAWALRLQDLKTIAVSFFGDGAANQGILLESANMAKLFRIPIIYVVENNLYAVGTSARESCATDYTAQRALGFGMNGVIVDGMDPAAVYLVLRKMRDKALSGEPQFAEAMTYRFYHHKGNLPGSRLGYRSRDEEKDWEARDPHTRYPETLKKLGILDEQTQSFIEEKVDAALQDALSKATVRSNGTRSIPDRVWPSADTIGRGLAGSGDEFRDTVFSEREDFHEFSTLTFINVISRVAARNMEKDPRIVYLGEEVANLGGGAYNATKYVVQKHLDRTFNTPISEAGFVGIAFGASLCGMKPIVEIMFPDFAYVAADQLFNQVAKLKYLYGGNDRVPLVLRTRIATGLGFGAQHSSDPGGLFALFPGWRIVAPSNPFDYVGLFNAAVISEDPVLVMEHHALYRRKGEVPRNNLDYVIALGKARVLWQGTMATVATYLRGVDYMEMIRDELEETGLSIECIDLRSLDHWSIDYESIGRSLKKTGFLIVVEETSRSMGIGSALADGVQERFFSYLRRPILHINSLDVPVPVSKKLEERVLLNPSKIKDDIISYLR
jgi:2-oxoisovalerate dehydrogenase E1 component